jgi:ribulose-phosphate 3-epimerase
MHQVEILPSILAADFARLHEEVRAVEAAGVSMLHCDVMDGHFVPNISLGPPVVESLRRATHLMLDVHLMITDPDQYAPAFAKAGAQLISVHQEACRHLNRTLHLIKELGVKAGVVINPGTPVCTLFEVLDIVDYVLVMSVNPGFGGQKFIPSSLRKIRELDRIRSERGLHYAIEIDGGVTAANAADIVKAGCDWLVAGSSVFHTVNSSNAVRELQRIARAADAVTV